MRIFIITQPAAPDMLSVIAPVGRGSGGQLSGFGYDSLSGYSRSNKLEQLHGKKDGIE
jgi:hypothetical protein